MKKHTRLTLSNDTDVVVKVADLLEVIETVGGAYPIIHRNALVMLKKVLDMSVMEKK